MTALCGAFTKFVFLQLPGWLSLITTKYIAGYITYGILSILSFTAAIFAQIGIKGNLIECRHTKSKKGLFTFISDGLKSTTPMIILSYIV